MQNPQIAGIMGKKTADRRAADHLGVGKRRVGALFPGKGAGKKCKQRQQAS